MNKIPKVFTHTSLKLNSFAVKQFNPKLIQKAFYLKIFLNLFTKKQEYEFDVIECEGFCEQPGTWIQ